jgi:hypothetical protein
MKVGVPALMLLSAVAVSVRAGDTPARTPVLVELFTSEGCSSCPPADRLLARLVAEQPVAGAEIVPLAFHVDYWDHLGWRDPFSSAAFTRRQGEYARAVGGEQVYTPQMIVAGSKEFVGSDERTARSAIATAAAVNRAFVRLGKAKGDAGPQFAFEVSAIAAGADADVILAITEDHLASDVSRGENSGRRLEHTAVVRDLEVIGRLDAAGRYQGKASIARNSAWKAGALHAVVFVQERGSRQVLGAARVSL